MHFCQTDLEQHLGTVCVFPDQKRSGIQCNFPALKMSQVSVVSLFLLCFVINMIINVFLILILCLFLDNNRSHLMPKVAQGQNRHRNERAKTMTTCQRNLKI